MMHGGLTTRISKLIALDHSKASTATACVGVQVDGHARGDSWQVSKALRVLLKLEAVFNL